MLTILTNQLGFMIINVSITSHGPHAKSSEPLCSLSSNPSSSPYQFQCHPGRRVKKLESAKPCCPSCGFLSIFDRKLNKSHIIHRFRPMLVFEDHMQLAKYITIFMEGKKCDLQTSFYSGKLDFTMKRHNFGRLHADQN